MRPKALSKSGPRKRGTEAGDREVALRLRTYGDRFAGYKERCIALLAKVVTVSLETEAMRAARAPDRTAP